MGTEWSVPQPLIHIKWINMLVGPDSLVVIGIR